MGLDMSLLAIPKEGITLIKKLERKQASEYSSIIFSIASAFRSDFIDFGHSDWMDFKKDADHLSLYYPKKYYEKKYEINTNRTYEVFDYLFAKRKEPQGHFRDTTPFFYDGITCDYCLSSEGSKLKYWDYKILKEKSDVLNTADFESLYRFYDYDNMTEEAVYKISQIHQNKEDLENMFNELKLFLEHALELKGFVFVFRN